MWQEGRGMSGRICEGESAELDETCSQEAITLIHSLFLHGTVADTALRIASRTGVALVTAKKALAHLEQRSLVERVQVGDEEIWKRTKL